MTKDYLSYYDLDQYLFHVVHDRFHQQGKLDAFDLFSIIIWKANRAKSKLAHRLIEKSGSLEAAAMEFTSQLSRVTSPKDRFMLTMDEWGFYLPMTSAILTVLWPDEFTVFDVRVCDELDAFHNLGNLISEHAWLGYLDYCAAVGSQKDVVELSNLRHKDQFLWARSAVRQLEADIQNGFRTQLLD